MFRARRARREVFSREGGVLVVVRVGDGGVGWARRGTGRAS